MKPNFQSVGQASNSVFCHCINSHAIITVESTSHLESYYYSLQDLKLGTTDSFPLLSAVLMKATQ